LADFKNSSLLKLLGWFQRRRFLKIDQSETIISCGGHVG
jgi:hypothetical protein